MGFSDKELKEAVKRYTTPREVPLPTFHEKASKYDKLREKEEKKGKKKRRYKLAYWYLEEYLKESEAKKIYEKYLDFKELVEYAYQMALNLIQIQNFIIERDVPAEEVLKELEGTPMPGKYDVPEALDKEFDEYAKEHPIEKASEIIPRRIKFQKRRRKHRRAMYSQRRMRIYDPLFAVTRLDAKQMYNDLKQIGRENEIRCQRFKELMESLITDKSVGSQAMKMFDKRTKEVMKQHEKRLEQFAKQAGLVSDPVVYDFSDLYT